MKSSFLKQSLILIFVCLLGFSCNAVNPSISSLENTVSVSRGKSVTIPVYIKDNPGIMGFHIVVDYPEDILSSPSVKRGECLDQGVFNDSITKKTKDSFDIIWSNSENMKKNGLLFELTFEVSRKPSKTSDYIRFTYIKEDTFNENWEDVALNTEWILITVADEDGHPSEQKTTSEAAASTSTEETSAGSQPIDENTSTHPVSSGKTPSASEESRTQNPKPESDSSETHDAAPIDPETHDAAPIDPETPESKENAEETVSEEDAIENVVIESVDEVLAEMGFTRISELPEEKRDEFVRRVKEKAIEKSGIDADRREKSKKADEPSSAEAEASPAQTESETSKNESFEKTISELTFDELVSLTEKDQTHRGGFRKQVLIPVILVIISVIIAAFVVVRYKKTKKEF